MQQLRGRALRAASSTSSIGSSSSRCCCSRPLQRSAPARPLPVRVRRPSSAARAAGSSSSGGAAAAPAAPEEEAEQAVPPFSEDELRQLADEEAELEAEATAEAWRSGFEDDVDGLYDYVDRAHMEVSERITGLRSTPEHMWEQVGLLDKLQRYPPGLVADMMGMGSWRLKGMVDEVFDFLTSRIEGSLRELLADDLALYPAEKWKDKGWDFIDSLDPAREWEGFSYVDMPDPLKGMEGYPRLLIENRVYSSRVFRKAHLELAYRQDGLQVLHMVLFPRYDFDLPILALDLVAAGGAVSLAIIDACPLSSRLALPSHYAATMQELQAHFLPDSVRGRAIPEWGSRIFSPLCVCIRPDAAEELGGFLKYAIALTRAHLMYAALLEPLRPDDKASARRLSELLAGQRRFCEQQLANTKTARVLEAAFDADFTKQYMEQLMFDFAPKEDVPWFDGSLARLYEYFDNTPEVWADAAEFLKTRMQLDEAKASAYLQRFLAGDASIKLPRLSFALQHMYDTDPDFSAAVDRSFVADGVPEGALPTGTQVGQHLARQLMGMVYGTDESGEPLDGARQKPLAADAAARAAAAAGAQAPPPGDAKPAAS